MTTQPSTVGTDRLLSTAQVSEWTGVSQNTLRFWRWDGKGPKWFRLGSRTVKYRAGDVQAWLDDQYAEINGAA